MFLVNAEKEGAVAKLVAVETLHSGDVKVVAQEMQTFLNKNIQGMTKSVGCVRGKW
jgi:hypothetical protein